MRRRLCVSVGFFMGFVFLCLCLTAEVLWWLEWGKDFFAFLSFFSSLLSVCIFFTREYRGHVLYIVFIYFIVLWNKYCGGKSLMETCGLRESFVVLEENSEKVQYLAVGVSL